MPDRACLLVDDEPAIRGFLRDILRNLHLQIFEAANATDALKLIYELNGRLDLLVSDINMPGDMDGLDLAHSVRHRFPAIAILLISGYHDKVSLNHAEFDLIPKPFVPEAILKAIEATIKGRDVPE